MILSTFHPSVNMPLNCEKSSLTTFNENLISSETQSLICDFFETLIVNEERVKEAREKVFQVDLKFDPMMIYQWICKSSTSNTVSRQ